MTIIRSVKPLPIKLSMSKPERLLVTIAQASEELGEGFSRASIYRRIDSGEWEEGKHWLDYRRKGSSRRILRFDLNFIKKELETVAGKR